MKKGQTNSPNHCRQRPSRRNGMQIPFFAILKRQSLSPRFTEAAGGAECRGISLIRVVRASGVQTQEEYGKNRQPWRVTRALSASECNLRHADASPPRT